MRSQIWLHLTEAGVHSMIFRMEHGDVFNYRLAKRAEVGDFSVVPEALAVPCSLNPTTTDRRRRPATMIAP